MDYEQFLDSLKEAGWAVPNRSFACKDVVPDWQVAFIRMGGKFQHPGAVTFVICVRHKSLRNLEEMHDELEKNPHSYPYILTIDEISAKSFKYQSKLLNYEHSRHGMADDWSEILRALQESLPRWLGGHTQDALAKEIRCYGEAGYIERIWLTDLQ
jgi:hypothetical protein